MGTFPDVMRHVICAQFSSLHLLVLARHFVRRMTMWGSSGLGQPWLVLIGYCLSLFEISQLLGWSSAGVGRLPVVLL